MDSTILGMGRKCRNLKTELLLMKIFPDSENKYKVYDAVAKLV